MDARIAIALVLLAASGCVSRAAEPSAPLVAERSVSLYAGHHRVAIADPVPMSSLAVATPDHVVVRGALVRFADGSAEAVVVKDGRLTIPGPPRPLHSIDLSYESNAPPDTFAQIRLFDLSHETMAQRETARR